MTWLLDVGFWLIGLALAFLLGALLLWFGLWGSRSKGRPRCPKCWYDMQGAPMEGPGSTVCPEGGKDAY